MRFSLFAATFVAGMSCISGCGNTPQPINIHRPPIADSPTGSIALVFTRAATGVTVALDGELVVERVHTDKIVIEGVTAGMADLHVAAGSGVTRLEREMRVDVEVGRTTTVPLGAPDPPQSSGFLNAALSVAAIVLSTALTNWLF